jgi:hypothetical protein
MSPLQKKFVELEKQKEAIKKFYEDFAEVTEAIVKEVGVNGMFQDEEGTVYKLVIPNGKYVTYEKISYVRTRRQHEERGDLSLKEAESAGFKVTRK